MEEEDELALLDYRTPKGQLIKLLEKKIKKPEIDDSLGKVLDQFLQLTNEQTTFLDNGIFHMNFAEDALLLQSCGQYYAARVDKLWNELLQFHTRMVKYDETTTKNCNDSGKKEARKLELARLEERLNRGKRKKIKLTEPETGAPQNGCYVFEVDQNAGQELFDRANLLHEDAEEQVVPPFEHNFEMFDDWRDIHRIDELEKKKQGSVVVSQYNKQKYRLKNFSIPNGDEMIYDWNDPEDFNTREGRLISVHHIRHLFEYNDRCLLPDEDFTIAKLRFAYILKKKWLVQNKIDPDAPYETYKAEYEKYQREFFENEKRKIQNMPQKNSDDLMKFYKALEKKEQLAKQAQEKLRQAGVKNLPEISFESLILDPLKEGYQGDYDPYIPVDDDYQPDGSVHIPTDGDHELELSNLFVNIAPKLPDSSAEEADKHRSDSGYFDGGFEADDESDREDNTDVSVPGTDTPFEYDKDSTTENKEITASVLSPWSDSSLIPKGEEETALDQTPESVSMEVEIAGEPSINVTEKDPTDDNSIVETSGEEALITPSEETPEIEQQDFSSIEEQDLSSIEEQEYLAAAAVETEAMNREIKEFVKLGTVDENFNYMLLENSFFKQTDDMIMILYNKDGDADLESIGGDSQLDEIIDLGPSVEKQKVDKSKKEAAKKDDVVEGKSKDSKKRKLEDCKVDEPPPKRRKLSQKQIEKLRRSLIEPVQELKWESFFSMNYQTEAGEGDVIRIDYESASEDEDDDTPANLADDDENQDGDLDHTEDEDKIEEANELNVSGYHSDHDGSHVSDQCRPETPALPLSQDSGIDVMDMSTSNLGDSQPSTQKASDAIQVVNSSQESCSVELGNVDLIAELSKNPGVLRDELSKTEKTRYEQQREEVRERVAEWKEHIVPKLKKLNEHDFDIHEYGSKIMDNMKVNETKRFGDLMTGKSSAEVVRYFISSLQLANTMNVEICGAKQGELSNSSFELKLLSKERYHEHLQEYQAPSEESLRDKLRKVQQIRKQNKRQAQQSHINRNSTRDSAAGDHRTQQVSPQGIMKRSSERPKTPPTNLSIDPQFTINASPSKKVKILNYKVVRATNQQTSNLQRPSTSWQADIADQQIQAQQSLMKRTSTPDPAAGHSRTQQVSPQSIMKRSSESPKRPSGNSASEVQFTINASPSKKIKILNFNVIRAANQQSVDLQLPPTTLQADFADQLNQQQSSPTLDMLSPVSYTPSRSSIDSGFMPSCDEDFLDQFDQLQQTSDAQLRSTPFKPRKILRVSFARNTNF